MSRFSINRTLVSTLLFFLVLCSGCGKAEIDTIVAANDTPGNTEKTARIQLVSGRKTSVQDSVSHASLAGPDKILATQVIAGQLLSFDKTSTTWKPVDGFRGEIGPSTIFILMTTLTGSLPGIAEPY